MSLRRVSIAVLCVAFTSLACFRSHTVEAQGSGAQVTPPGPPPDGVPPPPPGWTASVPPGQWVYTQQYGWLWMTYGDEYTYLPPNGTGEPLEFVFYGSYGWTWIAAPWVWGYGPTPWYGRHGPRSFAWYRHGYWRSPQRWRYVPYVPRERSEVARHGVRPAPPRAAAGRATPPPAERRGAERRERGEQRDGARGGGGGGYVPRGGGRDRD